MSLDSLNPIQHKQYQCHRFFSLGLMLMVGLLWVITQIEPVLSCLCKGCRPLIPTPTTDVCLVCLCCLVPRDMVSHNWHRNCLLWERQQEGVVLKKYICPPQKFNDHCRVTTDGLVIHKYEAKKTECLRCKAQRAVLQFLFLSVNMLKVKQKQIQLLSIAQHGSMLIYLITNKQLRMTKMSEVLQVVGGEPKLQLGHAEGKEKSEKH